MRRIGLFLSAVGFAGFLIGASGIDGQTFAGNAIMTACCGVVTIAGYRIFCKASRKAKIIQFNQRKAACQCRKRLKNNKNQTWNIWIAVGTIEGKESA